MSQWLAPQHVRSMDIVRRHDRRLGWQAIERTPWHLPISASTEMERFLDQRANIKFCVAQGKSQAETLQTLRTVYGDQTIGKTQCRQWFLQFKEGDLTTPIKDRHRPGRPRSVHCPDKIQEVQAAVNEDTRVTIPQLSRRLQISTGSVHKILHQDLKKTKRAAKFIPRILTAEQKETRVRICEQNIAEFEHNPAFIRSIITGDESSFCIFQPETKDMSRQWVDHGAPRPKKAIRHTTKKSTMLIAFFDIDGWIHHEFVPQGVRVTSEYYAQCLGCLREKIRKKRPKMWADDSYRILHDNASVHTAGHTVTRMMESNMQEVAHAPYSPDLAPCDFWLFPQIKRDLKGRVFRTVKEVQAAVVAIIDKLEPDDFFTAFDRLILRWRKCVAAKGEYFEGDNIDPHPQPAEEQPETDV